MNVVGRFIRYNDVILEISKIVKIYHYGQETRVDYDDDDHIVLTGNVVDKLWDLLQVASDEHLDVNDKLREMVVI